MAKITSKVESRLLAGIKKFQPIINNAKIKDINESDTVVIITDMLAEIFGYDKYSEITSEYSIKKTFCDIAIKINSKIKYLIEVKASGLTLKDDHIKQCLDYGANEGVDWVILTNGSNWKIFKIMFGKPITQELIYEFDFTNLNSKSEDDVEKIYYLCKEGIDKSSLEEYYLQKQTINKYFFGQLILTEGVIDCLRKTIKKISPDIKTDNDDIYKILLHEVIKREVMEGEKSEEAKKKINKWLKSLTKKEESKNVSKISVEQLPHT